MHLQHGGTVVLPLILVQYHFIFCIMLILWMKWKRNVLFRLWVKTHLTFTLAINESLPPSHCSSSAPSVVAYEGVISLHTTWVLTHFRITKHTWFPSLPHPESLETIASVTLREVLSTLPSAIVSFAFWLGLFLSLEYLTSCSRLITIRPPALVVWLLRHGWSCIFFR